MPKKEEWMRVGDWKLKLSNLEKNRSPKRKGKATLIWLANLVSLELHQMHVCQSDFDQPGYMVFDLGPADNSDCQRVDQAGNRWMNFTDPCHENTYMEINTSGGGKKSRRNLPESDHHKHILPNKEH